MDQPSLFIHSSGPVPAILVPSSPSASGIEGIDYLDSNQRRRVHLPPEEAASLARLRAAVRTTERKGAWWLLAGLVLLVVGTVVGESHPGMFWAVRLLVSLVPLALFIVTFWLVLKADNRADDCYRAERRRLGELHAAEAQPVAPQEQWA